MPWPLTEIPYPFTYQHRIDAYLPGTCWRIPLDSPVDPDDPGGDTWGEWWAPFLSPEFLASGRDFAWSVVLPDRTVWVTDFVAVRNGECAQHGWTVTGADDPATLSVTPSIRSLAYHGWLTNGELSDDVDGRRFP